MKFGFKVYLVVGGYSSVRLSSTEILIRGTNSWKTIASFPISASGMRAISYGQTILCFGNFVILIKITFT